MVGNNYAGAVIENCFVDKDVTRATSFLSEASALDAGCLQTEAMKSAATYAEFDQSIWNIVDGEYPTLRKGIIA